MASSKKESLFWGFLILLVGILFLLKNLGWHIDAWHVMTKYWPLILVYIGVKNIYYHFKNKA